MTRVPLERQRSNGHLVRVTPATFRLDASLRRQPKRTDQLLAWSLFLTAGLISLVALAGFCILLYLFALTLAGLIRHIGGL